MMSLTEKLKYISLALTAVNKNVFHYRRPSNFDGAIIWQEDSEDGSVHFDNHLAEQVIHGTIDYFTKKEFDSVIDDIQTVLDRSSHIGFDLNSIQYEDETGLIHYEWNFWVS